MLCKPRLVEFAPRDLRLHLAELDENEILTFTFKDGIFSFRSKLKQIAFPATGKDWSETYEIAVNRFQHFPKRINYIEVEISVMDNFLRIESCRYLVDKQIEIPQENPKN